MARTKDDAPQEDTLWVMSNRVDNRVVLFEKDPQHPGGEAFVGGDKVDLVYRTAKVEQLLRAGLLVEIPEPPDGKKKPIFVADESQVQLPNQPGQPVKLGRVPDSDLVPAGALDAIKSQQKAAPAQIASQAEMPPPLEAVG